MSNIITVSSAAAVTDLTTLARVKADLELTDDNEARDDLLTEMIADASDAIRTFLDRTLQRQTYVELVKGYGRNRLALTHTPIVSVSEVLCDSEQITDYYIEDETFLWRRSGWLRTRQSRTFLTTRAVPGSEDYAYQVTYTAGYLLPGEVGRNLPRDIERAAIAAVKKWYAGRKRDPYVGEKRVGDLQIRYAPAFPVGSHITALPDDAVLMLRPYIRL